MDEVICGDNLEVLPTLPKARMIFADPPDNTGQPYADFRDQWDTPPDYLRWLALRMWASFEAHPDICWWSLWPINFLE
jgi:DNA modification methylase